jgi:hypothetical protein
MDKQEIKQRDPARNNLCAAVQRHCVDDDKMQIESEIAKHYVNESDFNFVKMHFLNHFSDHICHRGNLFSIRSKLPEKAMMDPNHVYRQLNCPEAAFQIL